MVDKALFSSSVAEWESPNDLYAEYDQVYHFALDVCALDYNAKAPAWLSPFEDALSLDWVWVCTDVLGVPPVMWMNPPYGKPEEPCRPRCKKKVCRKRGWHRTIRKPGIEDWIIKADEARRAGGTVVCLLPARTDTAWWHEYIWDKERKAPRPGIELDFRDGRLKFGGATNPAPFPSTVVVMRPPDLCVEVSEVRALDGRVYFTLREGEELIALTPYEMWGDAEAIEKQRYNAERIAAALSRGRGEP